MPCFGIKFPDGTTAMVKAGAARGPICPFCGEHRSRLLCDFVIAKTLGGGEITCDEKMCAKCAKAIGPDKHLCPKHQRETVPG